MVILNSSNIAQFWHNINLQKTFSEFMRHHTNPRLGKLWFIENNALNINHGLQIMTVYIAPYANIQKTGIRYHGMSDSDEIL